jgi:hypothetical protein
LARPVGLHRHIDHRGRNVTVHDGDLAVQQIFQGQQLARPFLEPAQADRAAAEHH